MDNQHRKITGYRELSQEEIDLMNEIKAKGAELGELIVRLEYTHSLEEHRLQLADPSEKYTLAMEHVEARRWTEIGKTDIQKGLMALTRAVARPNFF